MFKYNNRNFDDDYFYGSHCEIDYSERIKILRPLSNHLKKVDSHRKDLYFNSISLNKIRKYKELLTEPICLEGKFDKATFTLLEQTKFERIAYSLGLWDICLQVRRDRFSFPKYLLCETTDNYDSGYGLVTAQYYISYDYEIEDERFVRLMTGHEKYFVRMNIFRNKLSENPALSQIQIDSTLKAVGDNYLSYAWHEDQLVSYLVADLWDIPVLKEIIEMIYLLLGSDLSSIRRNFTPEVKSFFSEIFPRKSLGKLLDKIEFSTANDYQVMEDKARHWYMELNRCFSKFLTTKIKHKNYEMPAYKIIFSNIFRLHLISDSIIGIPSVQENISAIERASYEAIQDIIDGS
jgi:hypothetical protein